MCRDPIRIFVHRSRPCLSALRSKSPLRSSLPAEQPLATGFPLVGEFVLTTPAEKRKPATKIWSPGTGRADKSEIIGAGQLEQGYDSSGMKLKQLHGNHF